MPCLVSMLFHQKFTINVNFYSVFVLYTHCKLQTPESDPSGVGNKALNNPGSSFIDLCTKNEMSPTQSLGVPAAARGMQSSKARHTAPLHQLAGFRGAFHTYWHAEIPEKSQNLEPCPCWTNCCSLQVCMCSSACSWAWPGVIYIDKFIYFYLFI